MSGTTRYSVIVGGEDVAEVTKKQDAINMANRERNKQRAAVKVVTNNGTVILERPAPKRINQSPRYSRVVPLPTDVKVPEGMRVAYVRKRRNGAILHDAETGKYSIMDITTGTQLRERFETARDAGQRLKQGVGKGKVKA